MKKRIIALLVSVVLLLSALTGCTDSATSNEYEPSVENVVVSDTNSEEEVTVDVNAAAEQAYMDFLAGKSKVKTAESFRKDDAEYNYDGLLYGEYSFDEMKSIIEEFEMTTSSAKYALLDLGQDGVKEMVLRFESNEPNYMNWTGILHYNGSGLDLNYYYEDGYRTFAHLYDSGWLCTGGSMGAGAGVTSIIGFDGKGVGSELFSVYSYYGTFVDSIGYDLSDDWYSMESGFSENYIGDFFVREYKDGESVKLSVSDWSEDEAMRAEEEAMIDRFVSLGAQLIAEEEMDRLSSLAPYESAEVVWTDL
ncbi:MAG: hypothetical protein E7559_09720 [Ruminococcaceae bacterium]|nr:hypothetical protein [Oscillospiraceae bacterium]